MLASWTATLARHGEIPDRPDPRRDRRLASNLGQICHACGLPPTDPTWDAAFDLAAADPYLRKKGLPLEMIISGLPKLLRAARRTVKCGASDPRAVALKKWTDDAKRKDHA